MVARIERASARSAAALISALLNSRATRRGLYFIGGRRLRVVNWHGCVLPIGANSRRSPSSEACCLAEIGGSAIVSASFDHLVRAHQCYSDPASPACCTTLPQRSISALMKSCNCSGERLGAGTIPSSTI
jgi:hypothetical protein